jgi:uncharacterized membrane protein YgcG
LRAHALDYVRHAGLYFPDRCFTVQSLEYASRLAQRKRLAREMLVIDAYIGDQCDNGVMSESQPVSPRQRLQTLLAVPEKQRTDAQWDEIIELEIVLAPGNREGAPDPNVRRNQGGPGGHSRSGGGGGASGGPGGGGPGGGSHGKKQKRFHKRPPRKTGP